MKTFLARFSLALLLLSSLRAQTPTPISGFPAISNVTSGTLTLVVDTSGTPATKKATVAQLISGLPLATVTSNGTMSMADKVTLAGATSSNIVSTLVQRDSSGNFSAGTITAASVTGLGSPVNATDAANKAYVDASAAGLVIKTPVVAATTPSSGNVTLSGGAPTTLDGVTLHLNDRVLVKNQTDDTQNGIYFVQILGTGATGTWARTTDANSGSNLVTGSYVFITGGTVNINAAWTMVTTGTIVIGTSHITWNLFSQINQILAANIIGQIVGSQVQDGALNTAKFATGIAPVGLVSSLPSPSGYTGPQVLFNTSDSKLYRYTGSAFIASIPATDLSTQITATNIANNSISTPMLQAGAVTTSALAAGAVTASTIAANTITAGQIAAGAINTAQLAAGAVNTSQLAANAVTAGQIAANTITAGQIATGTITADRLNITSLSAITANIGTITNGTLTSSASINVGSGPGQVQISSSAGLKVGSFTTGNASGNTVLQFTDGASGTFQLVDNHASSLPAAISLVNSGASSGVQITSAGVFTTGSAKISVASGGQIYGGGNLDVDGDTIGTSLSIQCDATGSAGSFGGYLIVNAGGSKVKIPFYNP